jgi:hypothetical protein
MKLKYQAEIDALNLSIQCPCDVQPITQEVEVFRFSLSPIDHEHNCLPNVVYDRKIGGKYPYSTPGRDLEKCGRCGASFYYNLALAIEAWKNLPPQRREKLKYTHLGRGVISPGDGLIGEPDSTTHFNFYEAEMEDENYLKKKFELIPL